MAEIQLRDVRKRFADVVAVDDINLTVEDGEFLVLVGPSGCGKSTTLRLIAGLESLTDGEISIGGRVVSDLEPKDRNVAMVFQNYALYPHMTAFENMSFGMKSAGSYTSEEIERRINDAAETLDIAELLARQPAELSGGEQQRVAIGRALIRDPQVFLMDEPLSNLDAKLRIQMRAELQELHNELETTTIYVTHDQTEAMTLGDRVTVMAEGSIQQIDTPQQLYDYPTNQFVASFIGNPPMNIFPVEITAGDDTYQASQGEVSIELPEAGQPLDPGPASLGVRPEDVNIVPPDDAASTSTLTLEVSLVETLGNFLQIYATAGDVELQVLSENPRIDVSPGDTIDVMFDPDRLHLFDADTGEVIYHSDGERVGATQRRVVQ